MSLLRTLHKVGEVETFSFVLLITFKFITAVNFDDPVSAARSSGATEDPLIADILKYKNCEPTLMSLLKNSLDSPQVSLNLQTPCEIFSFPKLNSILGSSYKSAWFPTTGKLLKGLVEATLNSSLNSTTEIRLALEDLKEDIKLDGAGNKTVNLSNLASPIGILPPSHRLPNDGPLEELFRVIRKLGLNETSFKILREIITFGKLSLELEEEFDASYYTTYNDLIVGIILNLQPTSSYYDMFFNLSDKVDANKTGKFDFEPYLISELHLPPISTLHNPYIKELIYTSIDPEHHVMSQVLESMLNNGEFLFQVTNFTFSDYATKGELLKALLGAYESSMQYLGDPHHDVRNMQIKSLVDKVKSDGGAAEAVDPVLIDVLNSIKEAHNQKMCSKVMQSLVSLYPFVSENKSCELLNALRESKSPSEIIPSITRLHNLPSLS